MSFKEKYEFHYRKEESDKIMNKYPSIKNIDFRIAVNDEFCDLIYTLKENDECLLEFFTISAICSIRSDDFTTSFHSLEYFSSNGWQIE